MSYSKLVRELFDLSTLYRQAESADHWCIRSPVGILRIVVQDRRVTEVTPAVLSACTLMRQEQAVAVARALMDAGAGECVALPWIDAIRAQYAVVQARAKELEEGLRQHNESYSQAVRYYWDLTREFRSGYDSFTHPGMARIKFIRGITK